MKHARAMTRWSVVAGLALALAGTCTGPAQAAPRLPAAGNGPALVVSLCEQTTTVDHLVVKRLDAFPSNGLHFSFPATVAVTDQKLVIEAAKAVCALPAMPDNGLHCPADWGVTYRLTFSVQSVMFPRVVVDATGCESVTGLLRTRWVARTPGFWHELGTVMNLKKPTWATFTGSRG